MMSSNNLAKVLWRCRKYDETEKIFRKTLEIREKILYHDHSDTLIIYNNLSNVLWN
jgi:hypothetical protein